MGRTNLGTWALKPCFLGLQWMPAPSLLPSFQCSPSMAHLSNPSRGHSDSVVWPRWPQYSATKATCWFFSRNFAGQKGVEWYIFKIMNVKKNLIIKNTLPDKVIIHNWWGDKEFPKQAKLLKGFITTSITKLALCKKC